MEPQIRTLVDIADTPAALAGRADIVLERGRWAAEIFQRFDRELTMSIVDAVARTAHENAGRYADWAVEETGFGVAAHKKIKNELTAYPLVDFYRDQDFINPRVSEAQKMVEIPRPAGVIMALTPSTNPIATINYKVLIALMTRNAIVISPHPAARECSVDAARMLAQAAEDAGSPTGVIQIIEQPTIPLVEEFMRSKKTAVTLATGGAAMVRSAYSSSNPAIGVGPGNAPVFVDDTADLDKAARRIIESKSFDNSALCTNESVLITFESIDKRLCQSLRQAGAYICDADDVERLRRYLFHDRGFNVETVGRAAVWIATECGIRVPENTKVLVAPITQIGIEEPLSREKLCPVLAYHVVRSRAQALAQARAVLRLAGAGHSAAIHTTDESAAMSFASAVEAYRVVVNVPCSQGASGFSTALAPTFTVGTGYFGRSSIGENVGPQHLIHWTRLAYNSSDEEVFGNYQDIPGNFSGPLPVAPADGVPGLSRYAPKPAINTDSPGALVGASREDLRQLIAEELRAILRN
jgi:acyl-CoA reductase-like NAD-dependent aldehyde dehydrogenase